jgi:hypothetical protein
VVEPRLAQASIGTKAIHAKKLILKLEKATRLHDELQEKEQNDEHEQHENEQHDENEQHENEPHDEHEQHENEQHDENEQHEKEQHDENEPHENEQHENAFSKKGRTSPRNLPGLQGASCFAEVPRLNRRYD